MNDLERIKTKLQKLLALARQGVGGEKDNARSVLSKLLAKHGLTLADLDDASEARVTRWFRPKGAHERTLLSHCVLATVPNWDRAVWRHKSSNERGYELTTAEFAQVELLFEIHRKALAKYVKKQMQVALLAYLSTNRLYAQGTADSNERENSGGLSPEDLAAIMGMMAGLRPTPVFKALTGAVA